MAGTESLARPEHGAKSNLGGNVVLDGAYNDPSAPIAIGALGKLLP